MIITLTVDGLPLPLVQVTLRKDATGITIDAQVAGIASIAVDAVCALSVDGVEIASATVAESTPGARITSLSATGDAVVGSAEFEPVSVLYRNDRGIRTVLDFTVAPGDTWQGIEITGVTSTIGSTSPGFTEVRFG
jgi:hypothetical protein